MGNSIVTKVCFIKDCNKVRHCKGACKMHYTRFLRRGSYDILPYKAGGLSHTPEYTAWKHIMNRVKRVDDPQYIHYGGRGITIYKDWEDYLTFRKYLMETIGLRPSTHHSIDRIDNNSGYIPGNIRWTDSTTQTLNRRKNRNNTTGYVGVSSYPFCVDTYTAHVTFNYKTFYIHNIKGKEDAAYIRDQIAMQFFGNKVITNFEY